MRLINLFDELDGEDNDGDANVPIQKPAVLVFLPGIHEIIEMDKKLKDNWDSM